MILLSVILFLDAQIFCNWINIPPPVTSHLAFLTISPLFVDRFERSSRLCHVEFDKEAIYDYYRSENFL